MTPGCRRAVITGAAGRVGRRLTSEFGRSGWEVLPLTRSGLDLTTGHEAIAEVLLAHGPAVVVNCAAVTDMERCEADPTDAWAVNADGVGALARACDQVGSHLLHLSTNYVFDGFGDTPYTEREPPNPLSVYGASKVGGERQAGLNATTVRLAWLFDSTSASMVRSLVEMATIPGATLTCSDDRWGSPSNLDLLAPVLVRLAADQPAGLVHLVNEGCVTYCDVARHIVDRIGAVGVRVVPADVDSFGPMAPRPRFSALSNGRLASLGHEPMASWTEALDTLIESLGRGRRNLPA